jgi:hypothetical protein
MARAALLAAALADSLTFLLLPPGAELNPLAAAYPVPALVAKAVLAIALALWPWRYALPVRLIGAAVWTVGAASNVIVLWRFP